MTDLPELTCHDCGEPVASVTVGPFMQVQCLGANWPARESSCGAKWLHSEWNSQAWANYRADRRARTKAPQ